MKNNMTKMGKLLLEQMRIDPKLIAEAAEKLQKYFHKQGLTNIEVSVGTDYNTAAQSLASNAYQLGFFPVKT